MSELKKVLLSLMCLSVFAGCSWAAEKKTVDMNGSTTVLPIAQKAAEKYMESHKDVTITVSGSGSGNGIKALIDGSTDIANSSRFIKDAEVKAAIDAKRYPVPFEIALDALVPIVNPANPVTDLSKDQLKRIYAGEITNWKEVGGEDKAIAVVGRDTSSGTFEVWEEKIMNKARVTPEALVVASNGAAVQAVAGNPLAIGYIGLGYEDPAVKAVKVDGIEGSVQTVRGGTYSLARALFMFTNGWPTGTVADVLSFMQSDEGQALVKECGFVPLRDVR
ncbi:phosphate ABC transporter substrate-binding protein [Jonquetella anthropi]|uniref:phosphate ABC transporter substrate-binding protein n=1 Tax=Jonquetella anthropi TaxID=428712 RepID=UPI0001B912F3|nr:phosphate ABC transporter substrate-binding protein [Jonquetella anthropi]EEX48973.1 phosphate binding protein [Jonquetella anthropi E3_33 E1]